MRARHPEHDQDAPSADSVVPADAAAPEVPMSRRERRAAARGGGAAAAKVAAHRGTRLTPPPVRRRDYAARKHG
jgi:hypothetical protein